MSDLEKEKLDLLEKKISQLEVKVKSSLEEKLREVSDDCNDLYKQITEIRNTIQEMYGEILESGRFQADQLLRMSERLENMAKDIYKNSSKEGASIKVNVNPSINPTMDNSSKNNSNENSRKKEKTEEKKLFDIKKMSLKEMVFFFSSLIVGVVVVIGGLSFTLYKLYSIIMNLLG